MLTLLLMLLPLHTAPPVLGPQDDAKALLERVRADRDGVDAAVFRRLVALDTEKSLDALRKSVKLLSQSTAIESAYAASAAYKGEVAEAAREWLASDARRHREATNRRAAARALVLCGDSAVTDLRRVFERSKHEPVRAIVFEPLIPHLLQEATTSAVQTVLDRADVGTTSQRAAVRAGLAACEDTKLDRLLCKHLGETQEGIGSWPEVLIEALTTRSGKDVDRALVAALETWNADVRALALVALGKRGDVSACRHVEKLLGNKKLSRDQSDRQAVLTLHALSAANDKWTARVRALARDDRSGVRMGAARVLADIADADALEALLPLLGDWDWRVRLEAYEAIVETRCAALVEPLIARLDVERGRMRHDLAQLLVRISGEDHGGAASAWRAWWGAAGAQLAAPAPGTDAPAIVASKGTGWSLFGLDIVADALFVVDTSRSMGRKLERGPWKGSTRYDAVVGELQRALADAPTDIGLGAGFFGTKLVTAHPKSSKEKMASAILAVARRQSPSGGSDLYGALKPAYFTDADTIYLFADGEPDSGTLIDPDAIVGWIARTNLSEKKRIHCFAIGREVPLLRRLAAVTGGAYVEVH